MRGTGPLSYQSLINQSTMSLPNANSSFTDNPYSPPGEDVAAIVFERVWLAGDFVQCVFWGEVLHGHRRYKYMQYECMNRNCFVALWNCSIQDALKTPTKSPLEAFIVHHHSNFVVIDIKWMPNESRHHGIYRQSRISRRTNSLGWIKLPRNTIGYS